MKLVKDTDQRNKEKDKISDERAEEAIKTIIQWIGENPNREGLKSTPKRVLKAYREYFNGYIDEFRYSNNARYSTSGTTGDTIFTPPTSAYAGATTTVNATGNYVSTATTAMLL